MSMYIGKDAGGTSVLHLTQGNTEQSSMKTGILDNTVFHSELPYVTWTEYPCTATVIRGIPFIAIDPGLADYLNASKYLFMVVIGGVAIQGVQLVKNFPNSIMSKKYGAWYSISNYNGGFYEPAGYPTSTFRYFLPPWGSNLSDIKLYVLNITLDTFIGITKPINEIYLSGGSLNIRGLNIFNIKYISPNQINSVDRLINIAGSNIQLINSNSSGSERLSLVSNSYESSIYKNGQALFTSLNRGLISYSGSGVSASINTATSITITLPSTTIGSLAYLMLTGYDMVGIGSGYRLYLPSFIKVGSGQSFYLYRLVEYETGRLYEYITLSSPLGTSNIVMSRSKYAGGNTNFTYKYFK